MIFLGFLLVFVWALALLAYVMKRKGGWPWTRFGS